MLIIFFWLLLKYRQHRKIILLAGLNLILMGFEGWFGSIVVASNLVPWTITVHLFFALLIIFIQLYIIRLVAPSQSKNLSFNKLNFSLIWLCFIITVVQLFLGTQVRESIDELTRMGIGREQWTEYLSLPYFIHRSFSWLVLALLTVIAYQNEKNKKNLSLRWSKRQPTKNELIEQFTELKSSFAISQNSILMMEKRITTLETDIAQLIEYINTKL